MGRQTKAATWTSLAALTAVLGSCLATTAEAQVTPGVQTLDTTRIAYRMPVDPAGIVSETELTEDDLAAKHNQSLLVRYPAGFHVLRCIAPAEFTCSIAQRQVAFTRRAGSRTYAPADHFQVEVRVPGIRGIYRTPAMQVYSDGEEILWNSAEESRPAPSVQVEGLDRALREVSGQFVSIEDVEGKIACPKSAVTYAKQWRVNPASYCAFAGYAPPAVSVSEAGTEIEGVAHLNRRNDRTTLSVSVTGLEPGKVYLSHLHEGTCAETTSPHYRHDPHGPEAPPNEMWPTTERDDAEGGLVADLNGRASGSAQAGWMARPSARSVWIHQGSVPGIPDEEDHSKHVRIACADLS